MGVAHDEERHPAGALEDPLAQRRVADRAGSLRFGAG